MLQSRAYQSYFISLLGLLTIGLCCSKFLISSSVILLGVGTLIAFLASGRPWHLLKGYGLLLIILYTMHILWLLNSDDLNYAVNDLRRKLPLLVLPIVFSINKELIKKHLSTILQLFAAASIGCAIVLLVRWNVFDFKNKDFRSFSTFISHIRFSICLVISALIVLNNYLETKKYLLLNIILVLPILLALLQMQSISGFALLFITVPLYLHWKKQLPLSVIFSVFTLIIIAVSASIAFHFISKDHVSPNLDKQSALGSTYNHFPKNTLTENGHRVYLYMAIDEMNNAWEERTGISAKDTLKSGYVYQDILIRYLSSKNLRKDASGINALNDNDIENVKSGYVNVNQKGRNAIQKRWAAITYEIDSYLNGYDIAGHSLTMRLEYFDVALSNFRKEPWFGVGTGDVKQSIANEHEARAILPEQYQKRAHNQLLTYLMTFGIVGAIILLYIIIIYCMGSTNLDPLGKSIVLLLFLSLFWEDVMETQAGVSAFVFFYTLLFAAIPSDKTVRYKDSIPSTILTWLKSAARP